MAYSIQCPPPLLSVAKTVHFTDDNTLESILERQGDGLVACPAEELGCITEGAGVSVLSLRNNKQQNSDSGQAWNSAQQRSLSAL